MSDFGSASELEERFAVGTARYEEMCIRDEMSLVSSICCADGPRKIPEDNHCEKRWVSEAC